MRRSVLDWIALIIVILGGLNWGAIGIWNLSLGRSTIFGAVFLLQILWYILVGVAALYMIYYLFKK